MAHWENTVSSVSQYRDYILESRSRLDCTAHSLPVNEYQSHESGIWREILMIFKDLSDPFKSNSWIFFFNYCGYEVLENMGDAWSIESRRKQRNEQKGVNLGVRISRQVTTFYIHWEEQTLCLYTPLPNIGQESLHLIWYFGRKRLTSNVILHLSPAICHCPLWPFTYLLLSITVLCDPSLISCYMTRQSTMLHSWYVSQ